MFQYNERLGISIPILANEWSYYPLTERQTILHEWETIRGKIPDRIHELEAIINEKQSALDNEENFFISCQLNKEISELASIINDLWLWFRTTPDLHIKENQQKQHS